ncbi:MAG: hypothetical protein ACM33T_17420 [Solirubrobacterales bacterium]
MTIDMDALGATCRRLTPAPGHEKLVAAAREASGLDFRLAHVDAGWFRLGGLMDANGNRIADDLEDWVDAETGGDMTALFERYADAGYRFTRHAGWRIYLTAPTGPGPLDFVQVEVDQVQEMLCRPLFEGDHIPDTVEELAALPAWPEAVPLAPAAYVARRHTAFGAMPELMDDHKGDPRFKRFVSEWSASSAGKDGHFCDHWVLRVVPFRTEDGEHLLEARPVPSYKPAFPDLKDAREHAAHYDPVAMVRQVDAEAGYPMAWYFLQVTNHFIHFHCMADLRDACAASGPAPLPPTDFRLVEGWVDTPYTFK